MNLDVLSDLFSYSVNVIWIYFAIATGFILSFHPFASWVFPSAYGGFAERHLPPKRRAKLAKAATLLTFAAANFVLYHGSQADLRALREVAQGSGEDAASVVAGGTDQRSATPVSDRYIVVVSISPGGAIRLAPRDRSPIEVRNTAPSNLVVYPPVGARFLGLSPNTPVSLFRGDGTDTFVCLSATECAD